MTGRRLLRCVTTCMDTITTLGLIQALRQIPARVDDVGCQNNRPD